MDFLQSLKQAPILRPMYNVNCLFDIPTGRYYTGKYGESILNGGLAHITGICGRGNTFKTVILLFFYIRVLDRIKQSAGALYDTEMSLTIARLNELAVNCLNALSGVDIEESTRVSLTDKTVYNGSELYNWVKESTAGRPKTQMGQTPFLNHDDTFLEYLYPFLLGVDSLSQFSSANVLKIQGESIGDSSRNIEAVKDAGAKTQMLMEMPTVTARNGVYALMTAHMGDDLALDPYASPQKKLSFLKNKMKFKNVPEKFTFLVNNCWHAFNSEVMLNQTTKCSEFPRDPGDDLKGDTDLQLVRIMNLRSKSGLTGLPFELIISQSEGLMPSLTEFNYIRSFDRYGLVGNDRNYQLALKPDVNLSRTTIRSKISDNLQLQRAMEITSELCQITNLWPNVPKDWMCTPETLFNDLKAQGYDWDILLNTRGWWCYDNDKQETPFLSTWDLLKMRKGLYKPYWMS